MERVLSRPHTVTAAMLSTFAKIRASGATLKPTRLVPGLADSLLYTGYDIAFHEVHVTVHNVTEASIVKLVAPTTVISPISQK